MIILILIFIFVITTSIIIVIIIIIILIIIIIILVTTISILIILIMIITRLLKEVVELRSSLRQFKQEKKVVQVFSSLAPIISTIVIIIIKKLNIKQYNIGLTEKNTQLDIISPIGYFKSPIGYIFRLKIRDLFSDSALLDSYIPNPQTDILSLIKDLRSPIKDNMSNWDIFC